MKKKIAKSIIGLSVIILNISGPNPVIARQSTDATPWGYTGLINMPTADVLPTGEFYLSGSYLFRSPGFIGNAHIGIFDRLELGIVGGFPSESFTGLAGNIKYQLIKPSAKSPTALSAGVNLLGINLVGTARANPLITGNNLYMVLSHDFNWKLTNNNIYNLFSGHIGFGGNIDGARIMAGLDIPVTSLFNLEAEYLGKTGTFNDMINFGVKAKPMPFLSVSLLTIGTSTARGFENTEFLINVAFNSKIPALQNSNNEEVAEGEPTKPLIHPEKPVITPVPVSTPLAEITAMPVPEKTPMAKITPEPEPTALPVQRPAPSEVPPRTPQPVLTSEPVPVETVPPTPLATPVSNFGILSGKVSSASGNIELQKVRVNLKGLKGNYNSKMVSDAGGNFKFNDLPPAEYILILEKEGFQEARRQLLIKAGDITESLVEMVPTNGSVSGRVIDQKGNPLADITIVLDKGKKVATSKDGKFTFNDLSIGSHLISIFRDSKEIKAIDLDITAGVDLKKEIVLDTEIKKTVVSPKNSMIIGKITGKNEELKGARVMMEGDKLTVMTISGQDGKYIVKNLPVGKYKMTVSKSGFTTRIFSVKIKDKQEARHDVELKPLN